jgi:hypothetical protein
MITVRPVPRQSGASVTGRTTLYGTFGFANLRRARTC